MIDLNHSSTLREAFSNSITERIDSGLEQETDRPGRSISASNIGDECARRVQYGVWAFFHPDAAPIRQRPIDGKLRRIFRRGNRLEGDVADWMRAGGFDLATVNVKTGSQFGWEAAGGHMKGFIDGIIRGVGDTEDPFGWVCPIGWECKVVGGKGWRAVMKHGVLKEYPKYDAQAQINMAYLALPAMLFTFLNADTCELWHELVALDGARAQAVSDKAVHILQATRAGELLPRAAANSESYPCNFCRMKDECWG